MLTKSKPRPALLPLLEIYRENILLRLRKC